LDQRIVFQTQDGMIAVSQVVGTAMYMIAAATICGQAAGDVEDKVKMNSFHAIFRLTKAKKRLQYF
jgi:hypothetical protein